MLSAIQRIARNAGSEILRFYSDSPSVDQKADGSPITNADRAAHRLIVDALAELTPNWPVLSEESAPALHVESQSWERFWLVDPLDGTKEFVKHTNEFTVNICLISSREPEMGVVYAPALQLCYFAERGKGAWKTAAGEQPCRIRSRRVDPLNLCVVASRDHVGPGESDLLRKLPSAKLTSMGSSLKFCLVAEGRADLYPRFGPTMEWDTGAAQCVVEEAGGSVLDTTRRRLSYQKADLRNPGLLTIGDPTGFDFERLFGVA